MATGFGELKVFSGSAHPELTREIAGVLGVSVGQARLRRFPDRLEEELRFRYLGYEAAERWLSMPWLVDLVARRARTSKFLQEAIAEIINETADPRTVFSLGGMIKSFCQ